jgi:hypothetical protein
MSQPATEPNTTPPADQGPATGTTPPAQPGGVAPTGWDGPFDAERARKAIEAGRREAAELREKARKFDEAEKAKMSELDQHKSAAEEHKAKATTLERENAQLRAVLKYPGMTEAQAKRLTGNTPEEILADAEEFAKELGLTAGAAADPAVEPEPAQPQKDITGNSRTRPTQQPTAVPRGGTDPSAEPEPDLAKIASEIPR